MKEVKILFFGRKSAIEDSNSNLVKGTFYETIVLGLKKF